MEVGKNAFYNIGKYGSGYFKGQKSSFHYWDCAAISCPLLKQFKELEVISK